MEHLETCLLIAETDRVLCHLVMVLTVFFFFFPLEVQNDYEIQLLQRIFYHS